MQRAGETLILTYTPAAASKLTATKVNPRPR
jgi:hypothetical protein